MSRRQNKKNKKSFSSDLTGLHDKFMAGEWKAEKRPFLAERKPIEGIDYPPSSEEFNEAVKNNSWHSGATLLTTVGEVCKLIESKEWSWVRNMDSKYVDIRIDMRDGGFVITNRDGKRINLEQIKWQFDYEKYKEAHGEK